ncbi:hypothetical protein BVI434_2530004 [Burkholderia vietnamiensis]|nr:hypothetical protein BVI434_2530004 [Burkholderia vietnamiensis]
MARETGTCVHSSNDPFGAPANRATLAIRPGSRTFQRLVRPRFRAVRTGAHANMACELLRREPLQHSKPIRRDNPARGLS